MHEGKVFDISLSMQVLFSRFDECLASFSHSGLIGGSRNTTTLSPTIRMLDNIIPINCNVSLSNGEACATTVAKDFIGRVMAFQISKKFIDVPEAAEAFSILKAIHMAIEKGWMNLWCYSDAKSIIQILVSGNPKSAQGFIYFAICLASSLIMFVFIRLLGATIVLLTMCVNGVQSFWIMESSPFCSAFFFCKCSESIDWSSG